MLSAFGVDHGEFAKSLISDGVSLKYVKASQLSAAHSVPGRRGRGKQMENGRQAVRYSRREDRPGVTGARKMNEVTRMKEARRAQRESLGRKNSPVKRPLYAQNADNVKNPGGQLKVREFSRRPKRSKYPEDVFGE